MLDLHCHILPEVDDGAASIEEALAMARFCARDGITPIVAHPERHAFFQEDPARLLALVQAGAWLQVTVDSLLGNHGRAPQLAGEELVEAYPEALLATDAHNQRRCSGLSAGYAWV